MARCSCRIWPVHLNETVGPRKPQKGRTIFGNAGGVRPRAISSSAAANKSIFARMMTGPAVEQGEEKIVMIEVSRRTPCVRVSLRKCLKAHRTATSMGGVKALLRGFLPLRENNDWIRTSHQS